MNRLEKIEKLEKAAKTLKQEFVGLDGIIDEIKQAITPWYVTPEIIKRPVVVSLWGMTGTGKTSVVRRLLELLEITKAINFDCGEENKEGNIFTITDQIVTCLNLDESSTNIGNITKDIVFVFDEFQYARTINEQMSEVDKPSLRPIWNILDSGLVTISNSSWDVKNLINFIEDFSVLSKANPEIPIKELVMYDREGVKLVLECIGYYWYVSPSRSVPELPTNDENDDGMDIYELKMSGTSLEEVENDIIAGQKNNDPYRPLKLINSGHLRTIIKYAKKDETDIKKVFNKLSGCSTIGELGEYLEQVKKTILTPKILNFSQSLVFILGNLDEAFKVSGSLSPDMDADIFYDITSKVTISDIKEALKSRFRDEQIARFGNSLIKYPTLRSSDFRKIIEKESTRILDDFQNTTGIHITIDPSIIDLLYSEGVYPVQGVRPVFTTIGVLLSPLFSDILIVSDKSGYKKVNLSVKDVDLGFRLPEKTVLIEYKNDNGESEVHEKTIKLTLGNLRYPGNRKCRFITSVHESGHAILMTYLTGKIPNLIVSISVDGGGFCTSNETAASEIISIKDVRNEVMISMGGYTAERLVFGKTSDRVLLGSSSDIESAFKLFNKVVYSGGYFGNFRQFTSYYTETNTPIPSGQSDLISEDGGLDLTEKCRQEISNLETETEKILSENKNLLVAMSKYLAEYGEMTSKVFIQFIEKYGTGTLTTKRIDEALEENSTTWYEKQLNDFLG